MESLYNHRKMERFNDKLQGVRKQNMGFESQGTSGRPASTAL